MDNKYDSPGQICAAVEAACGALAGHRGLLDWAQTLRRQLETALGLPAVVEACPGAAAQTSPARTARCADTAIRPAGEAAAAVQPAGGSRFPVTPTAAVAALPPIPQLARGAVLPPNRPFLAMVGDQHSGVNVEAPLSTIRQAVSVETEGQTAAIVAGLEASIGVQREILEAVQGIELGDETIGRAVSRYDRRNAIMLGGDSV